MLKVGIAGYGVVGKRRQKFIDLHNDMQVVAVCDQNLKGNEITQNNIRFHSNYEALLDENLDMVFVCLPNYLAPKVTIASLNKGMHVFCEKPPGRCVEDIETVRAVEANHPTLKLKYGFNHRYHDSIIRAYQIIQLGELGKIINLRGVYGKSKMINFDSDWRTKLEYAGGGILLDQGIHMVDMIRLFAGDFDEVHSFISNDFWKHNVEDNAYAIMRSQNGVVAMLHSSATQWRHRFHLDIHLEKGAITLSGILSGSKSYGAETITVSHKSDDDCGDPLEETTRYNTDNSWKMEIDEFADCVLNNQSVKFGTSLDALLSMKMINKIYNSDHKWFRTMS